MAQDYDVTIKLIFRQSKGLVMERLVGGGVTEWLNVELPRVRNPRVDLLGRRTDGSLVHIEIESSPVAATGERVADYHLGLFRLLRVVVVPIVLYVGREPLNVPPVFDTGWMRFEYQLLDVRDFPGEDMLASEDLGDNMLALLTKADRDRVIERVLSRISELGGEARRTAIEAFVLLSGLRDLEAVVTERIKDYMPIVDIMENKVFGPRIREGIEQGRREGVQKGEATVINALLRARFGEVPAWVSTRIAGASEPQILQWAERLLTASTIDDVFAPDRS